MYVLVQLCMYVLLGRAGCYDVVIVSVSTIVIIVVAAMFVIFCFSCIVRLFTACVV